MCNFQAGLVVGHLDWAPLSREKSAAKFRVSICAGHFVVYANVEKLKFDRPTYDSFERRGEAMALDFKTLRVELTSMVQRVGKQ